MKYAIFKLANDGRSNTCGLYLPDNYVMVLEFRRETQPKVDKVVSYGYGIMETSVKPKKDEDLGEQVTILLTGKGKNKKYFYASLVHEDEFDALEPNFAKEREALRDERRQERIAALLKDPSLAKKVQALNDSDN